MIEFLGAAYCNILREGCRNGKAEVKRIMAQIPIAISAAKRRYSRYTLQPSPCQKKL